MMVRIKDSDNFYFDRVASVVGTETIGTVVVYIVAIDNIITAVRAEKTEKIDA